MGGQSSNINTSQPAIGALRVQQSSYGLTIPRVYGRTRVAGNLIWYADFKAIPHTETTNSGGKGGGGVKQTNTTYTYEAAVIMALGEGVLPSVNSIWRGKEHYEYKTGSPTPLSQLGLSYATGALGQTTWGYLTTNHPEQALGYSGVSYVFAANYQLSDNAEVHNHNFEVDGPFQFDSASGLVDGDPALFIPDAITNDQSGAGFPASSVDSLTWFGSYVRAMGLFLSPAMTSQKEARQWVNDWCRALNSEPIWSEGKLKIVPYGDSPVSGNGYNFIPDTTPQYDLTEDDFIVSSPTEDPVKIRRKSPADAYNKVIIEYNDRDNQYNVATAEASDLRSIELYGERPKDVLQMHDICTSEVAGLVAHLILQRELHIRNTYSFKLGYRYGRLEPMDLVTLTDGVNLDKTPVRVIKVRDTGDEIEIEAEDWPLGIASATKYPHEKGSGFSHEYNAEPGDVSTPVFFEAPVTWGATGLEVLVAVSGAGQQWGGCHIWASLDGETYKQVGTMAGGSRYGQITGAIGTAIGASLPVSLAGGGGQIGTGTSEDAAALQTLCWIGTEDGGEYVAHTLATLTGANQYTLVLAQRGAYNSGTVAHSAGEKFVRVDQAIGRSGVLDRSMVGKPIYFKFTSFNVYGGGVQSLADVNEYVYNITGYMLKRPPSDVTGLGYQTEKFGVTVAWAVNPEPDIQDYHIKIDGTSWDTATDLKYVGGNSFPWEVQLTGGRNVWVKARDIYGNESTNAAQIVVNVNIPGTTLFTAGIEGPNAVLKWVGVEGAFSLDYYELRYGTTWAAGTFISRAYVTQHTEKVSFSGTRRYWVAAVDVAGNVGTPVAIDLTITSPGAVTNERAEVIDNNVLLYWGAPTTGSLPVDRYDIKKGATLGAATSIGSNGNSTFTTVFEQVSGLYTYWIAAVDTAGNVGAYTSVSATVNQPSDYILRSNIDSAFSGTKTNMVLEDGALIGPVNTTQQWSQHFSANSWTNIADQIAAGYTLFAEPSMASCSYQEDIDYGAAIPATMVTVTPNADTIDGALSVSCQIAYKLNVGDSWTNASAGTTAFITTSFRYLRVTLTYTGTGPSGRNIVKVNGINIKLANKLKTDSGGGTAAAADSGGTLVNFGISFVDVQSIVASPRGTAARHAVVNFTDVPNPTSFRVLLFDTSGTRVSGDFDYTARGY